MYEIDLIVLSHPIVDRHPHMETTVFNVNPRDMGVVVEMLDGPYLFFPVTHFLLLVFHLIF